MQRTLMLNRCGPTPHDRIGDCLEPSATNSTTTSKSNHMYSVQWRLQFRGHRCPFNPADSPMWCLQGSLIQGNESSCESGSDWITWPHYVCKQLPADFQAERARGCGSHSAKFPPVSHCQPLDLRPTGSMCALISIYVKSGVGFGADARARKWNASPLPVPLNSQLKEMCWIEWRYTRSWPAENPAVNCSADLTAVGVVISTAASFPMVLSFFFFPFFSACHSFHFIWKIHCLGWNLIPL